MAEREYIELITNIQGEEDLKKLGGIFEELIEEAKKAGVNVDRFAEKLKSLANAPRRGMPIYDQFISKLKTVSGIAAIGMGLEKSINLFASFDDVARKVQATTGANAETMELLRYQAKQLGDTTSWSASEAAEAQFEFAKAGFSNNEILAATSGILDTATAAEMGLAEATEITAGALRMFNLSADKSTFVGDMLTKTASSTTTGVRDLAESLKYSGSGAKQFGLNLQQTLGILGKLGDMSLKGSSAGTALQAVFSTIQNKNKAKMLVDVGINLTQDGKYRNILDIIDDIREKTSQMEKAQAESFINQVFQEQGSQAMNRLLAIPKEDLNSLIEEINNSQGFAKDLANTLNGGVGGAFRSMGSAAEGLGISIGAYLEPAVISLINGATEILRVGTGFIDWLNSGSYTANIMTFAIVSLATGYGAYKSYLIGATLWQKAHTVWLNATKIATAGLLGVKKLLAGAYLAATVSGGGFAGVLAFINALMLPLTGSIGLVVAGIAGATAGFYFLYQKSERFRNAISPLINALKSLWNWVKKFDFVGNVISNVKAGFGKIKDFFIAGTQGKTKKQQEEELNRIIAEVEAGGGTSQETVVGTGANTDYLITGGGSSVSGGVRHNGYYLKGSKNITNTSQGNIYTENSNSSENSTPQETTENLIVNTLQVIATTLKEVYSEMKTKKSGNGNTYIVNDVETTLDKIVTDLQIALGNM